MTRNLALIELLCDTVERDRFPHSSRLRPYKVILLKLNIGTTHGPTHYRSQSRRVSRVRVLGKKPRR